MAALACRHNGHTTGRTFRHPQSSTGNGISRALMSWNSFRSGVVYRPDHGSVSRVDLDDLNAGAKTSRLDAGGRLVKGERREHSCPTAVGRFQFRFLLLKIEFFDDYGLSRQLRPFGNPRSGIAEDGSGLLCCFAIDGTVESSEVDQRRPIKRITFQIYKEGRSLLCELGTVWLLCSLVQRSLHQSPGHNPSL